MTTMYTYTKPEGTVSSLYASMLTAGHLLIAGATGSGKSVLVEGLIHTAIFSSPAVCKFILIDQKRVDLCEYRDLPHVLDYATEPAQIVKALEMAVTIMDARYDDMARRSLKDFDGARLYVVIDELADLMTDKAVKRAVSPLIQRLTQLGRAAKVTVIGATQCVLSSIINSEIKVNFPNRVALRTATAQDSRNIIGVKGAELLPDPKQAGKAYGYIRSGANLDLWELPRYDDAERRRIINHWMERRNVKKSFSLFGRRRTA